MPTTASFISMPDGVIDMQFSQARFLITLFSGTDACHNRSDESHKLRRGGFQLQFP